MASKKPCSIFVTGDLNKPVKSMAPMRRMDLQGAYDSALRLWLGVKPDPLEVPEELRPVITYLIDLFSDPNTEWKRLLKASIIAQAAQFQETPNRKRPHTA